MWYASAAASELKAALLQIPLPGVISAYLKASTVPFTYIAFVSTGEHKLFSARPQNILFAYLKAP